MKADEPIASLETDKVAVEVPSPVAGVIGALVVAEGDTVEVGALIATIEAGAAGQVAATPAPAAEPRAKAEATPAATAAPAGARRARQDERRAVALGQARRRRDRRRSVDRVGHRQGRPRHHASTSRAPPTAKAPEAAPRRCRRLRLPPPRRPPAAARKSACG